MRKFTAVLLTLCLLLASVVPSFATVPVTNFTDVSTSDWFYTYVKWGVDNDYFAGTSATTFSPNDEATREQVVKVFANYAGESKLDNNVSPFTDVEAGRWSAGAIKWAVDMDIAAGVGGGKFNPTGPMTRQDVAVYIANFAKWYCEKTDKVLKEATKDTNFSDEGSIASYAKASIEYCVQHGLLAGYPDGTFKPTKIVTRAEFVTILHAMEFVLDVHGGGGGGGGGQGGGGDDQPDEEEVDENDLIYKAMQASAETADKSLFNDAVAPAEGYVKIEWTNLSIDPNGLEDADAAVAKDAENGAVHRAAIFEGSAELDSQFVTKVVETAVEVAYESGILGVEPYTEEDLEETAKEVLKVLGVDISKKNTAKEIAQRIYAGVKAYDNANLKEIWANFREDNHYYMESLDVKSYDGETLFSIDTNGANGPSKLSVSRKEAMKALAAEFAKQMIASAEEHTTEDGNLPLEGGVSIVFNNVDQSAAGGHDLTMFPVTYDLIIKLALSSDSITHVWNGQQHVFTAIIEKGDNSSGELLDEVLTEAVHRAITMEALITELEKMQYKATFQDAESMEAWIQSGPNGMEPEDMPDVIAIAGSGAIKNKIDTVTFHGISCPTEIADVIKKSESNAFRKYLVVEALNNLGVASFDDAQVAKYKEAGAATPGEIIAAAKDMDLVEIAKILTGNAEFQSRVENTTPLRRFVKACRKGINLLPAEAEITINGKTFKASDFDAFGATTTISDALDEVVKLLDGSGPITLNMLQNEGVGVSGSFGTASADAVLKVLFK